MATFRKRAGGWRAEICRLGVRASKTFPTKAAALEWATQREAEILEHGGRPLHRNNHTLCDALTLYANTVSPQKKGERWEKLRIDAFIRQMDFVGERIQDVGPSVIAAWRDSRLRAVSPSTVNRELGLLSGVFNYAVKEWRWCTSNPVTMIMRPKNPAHRERRVWPHEIEAILEALEYSGGKPATRSQELALVFLLAIETAMRQGEILGLDWSHVHLKERYLHIPDSKNDSSRNVPLSAKAVELLQRMGEQKAGEVFILKSGTADTLFRRARDAAGIYDLRFHDTRHEATTRLARKLEILDLARTTGHKDLKKLMIYYNPTASELAERLNQ